MNHLGQIAIAKGYSLRSKGSCSGDIYYKEPGRELKIKECLNSFTLKVNGQQIANGTKENLGQTLDTYAS